MKLSSGSLVETSRPRSAAWLRVNALPHSLARGDGIADVTMAALQAAIQQFQQLPGPIETLGALDTSGSPITVLATRMVVI